MNLQNHSPIIQGAAAQPHANGNAVAAIHRPASTNLTQVREVIGSRGKDFQRSWKTMFRRIMFALVALVTVGAAAIPSAAQARGWGRGRGWGWGGAAVVRIARRQSEP